MSNEMNEERSKIFREDLRQSFCFSTAYKGHKIEVYLMRKEYSIKVRRHLKKYLSVYALSYTKGEEEEGERGITYSQNGVVGFDSNHGWYDNETDKDQWKHIASALNQAQCYIDEVEER